MQKKKLNIFLTKASTNKVVTIASLVKEIKPVAMKKSDLDYRNRSKLGEMSLSSIRYKTSNKKNRAGLHI